MFTKAMGDSHRQFNPYTLTQYLYSPWPFLHIPWATYKENLFNNQELLKLAIISFFPTILMDDWAAS